MLIEKDKFDRIDESIADVTAAALVAAAFGIRATATRLSGERDSNFRIDAEDGKRFLLKISNSGEEPGVSDLQTQALLHLAAANDTVPVPRVVPALDGAHQHLWHRASGPPVVVRLLTYLPGAPLAAQLTTVELVERVGRALALLDVALAGFSHPADRHDLLWDLQHVDHSEAMLDAIEDRDRRNLARRSLAFFAERVRPRLGSLRHQVVHNDLNPSNILIDRTGCVSGLLDLGDAIRAPLVADVAVAACYHVGVGSRPLQKVAAMLKGYSAVRPLEDQEIAMVAPLIVARLSKIVTISAWRARLHPSNRSYILRNAETSWRSLDLLMGMDLDGAGDALRRSLGRTPA